MSPESNSRGGGNATGKTHFGSGGRTLESSSGSDGPPLCPVGVLEGSSINASLHHSQGLLQLSLCLSQALVSLTVGSFHRVTNQNTGMRFGKMHNF